MNYAEHGCGTYHIGVRDWLPFFSMAYCKIVAHLCQKMLGDASQYKNFVQCQSWNGKQSTPISMHQGLKKEYRYTNNVRYKFWFYHDDIRHCVSDKKKKYVLEWHVVPNMSVSNSPSSLRRSPRENLQLTWAVKPNFLV